MKLSNWLLAISATIAALAVPSAAQAARIAINQNPDGTPIFYGLGGYCDLNGDDCDPDYSGGRLGYQVSFNGSDFSNKVFVTGNGLVTFGAPVDFFASPSGDGYDSLSNRIYGGDQPNLADYGVNLVSAGQSNDIDYTFNAFMQSASLSLHNDGSIWANFFTCFSPTQHSCPKSNSYTLVLRPGEVDGETGFVTYLFGSGISEDGDVGYATNGTQVLGSSGHFFVPAQFQGDVSFYTPTPEPATWGLMILGFGAVGASLRANRRRAAALAA